MDTLPRPTRYIPRWEYARLYYSAESGGRMPGSQARPASGRVTFSNDDADLELREGGMWAMLRNLGNEGWEMIGWHNFPFDPMFGGASYEMYFKRPQRE